MVASVLEQMSRDYKEAKFYKARIPLIASQAGNACTGMHWNQHARWKWLDPLVGP